MNAPIAGAALALDVSLGPALLPHPVWVQSVVGGVVAAQGYLAGIAGRALVRRLPAGTARLSPVARWLPPASLGALIALLVAAVLAGHAGQARLATAMGMPAPPLRDQVLATGLAIALGAALVATGIAIRVALRALHRRARQVIAITAGIALTLAGCAEAATADGHQGRWGTMPSLGRKGQEFLAGDLDAAEVAAVTGRAARDPIRVYVGRSAAADARSRARIAVQELDRAGAFDRAVVLLAVPTGSGWVNPSAVRSLEYLYGGDAATVAVQYAESPSWVSYLRGGEGVEESARALLAAVQDRVASRPLGHRPRLLMYGESLGALGGLEAARASGGHLRPDGELWVGVPGLAADAASAEEAEAGGRVRLLTHADDPVAAWSPALLVRPAPGWPHAWYPLLTFWQATADVMSVYHAPYGHGHRYAGELVGAWLRLAPPVGVPTAAPPARLAVLRAAAGSTDPA